jgi:hypothetical protein
MIRTRFKKVLLIAPEASTNKLTADYENVRHVHALNGIFPAIFELSPNLIILDNNYLSTELEKIVRRIRTNSFYSKIKICCYKTKAEITKDDLLKAIGVDYFIYEEELRVAQKSSNISELFTKIVDRSVLSMPINTAN